ncbi:hypothetical protein H0H81_012300 [Sphagnurus paluster]|uniref:Late embryogenesis abundant protein LEA-2 subgroup domain-containing protein n=1 Tax=Sphagnurus paluster TaxID=117069 RepID=A0A9P7FWF8_9AGAR|nr:hypothetical protein H0H81_012300 [Sphagnurus paluster]
MRFIALFVSIVSFLSFYVSAAAISTPTARDLSLGSIINSLGIGLVTKINTFITVDSFTTNLVSVNFDVKNPLPLELAIDRVVSSAGVNGTVYAKFDQTFKNPVVVPILGSVNSGTFGNVLLTKGIDASLDLVPLGWLDLISTDVYVRAGTIKGKLGIPITIQGLKQSKVTTT